MLAPFARARCLWPALFVLAACRRPVTPSHAHLLVAIDPHQTSESVSYIVNSNIYSLVSTDTAFGDVPALA